MKTDEETYYIIRNNMVILTNPHHRSDNPIVRDESLFNLKNPRPKGYLSWKAQKKMRNKLELWYNSIYHKNVECKINGTKNKHYMSFFTLTLSAKQDHEEHDDLFIKRYMLYPYIQELQKKYNVENYIWKAERQKHTNNTHFHVIIDKYIDYHNICNLWNKYQKKYGYIDRYREKRLKNYTGELKILNYLTSNKKIKEQKNKINLLIKSIKQNTNITEHKRKNLLKFISYLQNRRKNTYPSQISGRIKSDKKNNFENPNSTDIKNIKKVKSIIGYMAKEMSKNSTTEREHSELCMELTALNSENKNKEINIMNINEEFTQKEIEIKQKELIKNKQRILIIKDKMTILEKKLITGRVHGQSDNLNRLYNYMSILDSNTQNILNKIKESKFCKFIEDDFCSIYILKKSIWNFAKRISSDLYKALHSHYTQLYNDLYISNDDIQALQEIDVCLFGK